MKSTGVRPKEFPGMSGRCHNRLAMVVALLVLVGLMWSWYSITTFESYTQMAGPALRSRSGVIWMDAALASLLTNDTRDESEKLNLFLKSYTTFCETRVPTDHPLGRSLTWCSCLSTNSVGRLNLTNILQSHVDILSVKSAHPEVSEGGHWKPIHCEPRQKIAIIIPYRGRQEQLHIFLHYMIPFLQRQLTEFKFFVVEQGEPEIFNKAALMNVGFLEVSRNESYDCYFFHDVDTFPEDDRNFYTCTFHPHHLGWYVSRFNYRPFYKAFVGGGIGFTDEQLRRINGFSNKFYGWGGEDDDTYNRIIMSGMAVTRFPVAVARYTILEHKRDSGNPLNPIRERLIAALKKDKTLCVMRNDGINSIKYSVRGIETKQLFTWILVDFPPPSKYYNFTKKTPTQTQDNSTKTQRTQKAMITHETPNQTGAPPNQTQDIPNRTQETPNQPEETSSQTKETPNQTQEAVTETQKVG